MLGWLWPFGIGGKMPVGGDVTQFFLGLMGFLGESLGHGRLPVWNDLWGYGFPGIGESQMGVYYPPHLLLYGALRVEWAYVASLVLHTLWGALGAWWAARRFGVSPIGSSLAALAFSASGFFVIHMPHPWGYTVGSWMPWAWGLAWSLLNEPRVKLARSIAFLGLALVLQVLPGHFQLAFVTQSGIMLMLCWSVIEPWIVRATVDRNTGSLETAGQRRRAVVILACVLAVFPLAALQLWPTLRLARLAAAQRDFDYLSGFAATPWHLVNYVAPLLFHGSELWRPLVWDPLHTTPEEQLGYVGLVPLFLAILVVWHDVRHDRAVRMLAILAVATLLLSLGPYVPGFRLLIMLPGFSFFRAPARWSLATALALAILAGKGLDRSRSWPRTGRALGALTGLSAVWVALVLGIIELALASATVGAHPWLSDAFERVFQTRPWTGDAGFAAVAAEARKPVGAAKTARSFAATRTEIYHRELAGTAGLFVAIGLASWWTAAGARRRHLPACLLVLSCADLLLLGQHRVVAIGPLRPLASQSPVLAELARALRGTRVISGLRNLPMLVRLEPVAAYRTLDLPALEPLTRLAQGSLGDGRSGPATRKALRTAGVGVRVLDPMETAIERNLARAEGVAAEPETIDDPALAGWLFGPRWAAKRGPWSSRFRVLRPEPEPHRAWLLPLTAVSRPDMLDHWSGDLGPLLDLFDKALPLAAEAGDPGVLELAVDAEAPGWILITQLADPQWQARWRDRDGQGEFPADIVPSFRMGKGDGGWQRVRIPGPGRWSLHLRYVADDVAEGLAISAFAWLAGGLILAAVAIRERRKDRA